MEVQKMATIFKKYDVRLVQDGGGLYDMDRKITSSTQASELCKLLYDMDKLPYEKMVMITLNTQHDVVGCFEVGRGTVDEATVYPREIALRCLLTNAKAVILTHNHPSGSLNPSTADMDLTRRIEDVLKMLDIRLLDHIIVTSDKTYSFADNSLL
jgi:DNA repair protein RadC